MLTLPPWIEALCSQWEARARTLRLLRSVPHQARGQQLAECAKELREAAVHEFTQKPLTPAERPCNGLNGCDGGEK